MSTLRVTQAFAILSDPSGRVYTPGTLVDDSDPVVKGRAHFFEPVETGVADPLALAKRNRRARRTETASAAPGEVRGVTPPAEPEPAPEVPAEPEPAPEPAPEPPPAAAPERRSIFSKKEDKS